MIAQLAGHDPLRMDDIYERVRVRDGLDVFSTLMQREAANDFRHAQLLYVQGGLKNAPKLPNILRPKRKRSQPKGPFTAPEKPAFLTALEDVERAGRRR